MENKDRLIPASTSQNVFVLNVTGVQSGKFASNLGTAHELLVTGLLMRWGFDVSVSSVKGGAYDLLISAFEDGPSTEARIIKAQTKTCTGDGYLKFVGGTRGGVDRSYTSERKPLINKSYIYSEEHNDLIIGVNRGNLDLYLIPTLLITSLGKSISIRKLQYFRNRWEILTHWRPEYLSSLASHLRLP